jgi:sulfur oxygenase/reductase
MSKNAGRMDRRNFIKMAALAAGTAGFAGRLPFAQARETTKEPESPIYLALNMSKVTNNEESFQLMMKVGPRVCITTATHPGFVGFQANIQTGILPLAGRYGGGKVHMEKELNPVRNYQYTMWKHWKDHDDFHAKQFDRIFELCGSCLSMVIEGPWEPVYRIVKAKMPPIRSMGQITDLGVDMQQRKEFIRFATPMRCVAMAEHTVKPGREQAFEQGAIETMEALSDSTGFLGYMILKQIGVCALGSFMLDPASMGKPYKHWVRTRPRIPNRCSRRRKPCQARRSTSFIQSGMRLRWRASVLQRFWSTTGLEEFMTTV